MSVILVFLGTSVSVGKADSVRSKFNNIPTLSSFFEKMESILMTENIMWYIKIFNSVNEENVGDIGLLCLHALRKYKGKDLIIW